MRHLRLMLIPLILCSVLLTGHSFAWTPPALRTEARPQRLLVKLKPGISPATRDAIVRDAGARVVDQLSEIDLHVVELPAAQSHNALQAQTNALVTLERDPRIEYVEPDLVYRATNEPAPAAAATRVVLPLITAPQQPQQPLFTPNDPGLSRQYAWERIDAFAGWGVTRGSSKTIIAIIDSGVQLNHPDLQSKLIPGRNFVEDGRDSLDPNDGNGHGTHVAGIAAAATNNGVGIAGTCPNCLIMPVRVLDDNGEGYISEIAAGIRYAVNNGANVINLSLGGPYSSTIVAEIENAWSKGIFAACAAGNDGTNNPDYAYPAPIETCFAVASTTQQDSRSGFSNYGSWVDIAAPGGRDPSQSGPQIYSTWNNGGYESISGTSMATPYVAGVAGLLASQGLTNKQIAERLCSSADQISGTKTYWRCGRLNLYRAVSNR